jgi:hypothetical protein
MAIDFAAIRRALASLPSDHDAAGDHSPTVDEIFTPEQHANALDPNTPVVVGARGTGKSFWAGVLGKEDTRRVTAEAYPHLHLDQLIVKSGYAGLLDARTIDNEIPKNQEQEVEQGPKYWQAAILRAAKWALSEDEEPQPIREVMNRFSAPEDAEKELRTLDKELTASGRILLVTFDALDTLSREWVRSSRLVDALFEAIWALRAYRAIKAKVFIRPEQLEDENLRFVELPKLRSGRVELEWGQVDLYGMLYWQLSNQSIGIESFRSVVEDAGIAIPSDVMQRRRHWPLLSDRSAQKQVMDRFAGLYMGANPKKGGTYDWPYKHLGDAQGKVTPRSFIKLLVEAAKFGQAPAQQVVSAEGIRHGLREASQVRVTELVIEYKWVKRALAPLAGITVPCELSAIFQRWQESDTIKVILEAASNENSGFLPPFPVPSKGDEFVLLANAMIRIGLLGGREDNRVDFPDLFRVAAKMLRKGGVPPRQNT